MFANLNLQLTSILKSGDAGLVGAEDPAVTGLENPDGMLSFSEFFSLSSEETQLQFEVDGEILPLDGQNLPPDDVSPLLEGAPIIAGEELPRLREQELASASVLQETELVDVELELTLDYASQQIPAAIPGTVSDDALVLPPGLTLTATGRGLAETPGIATTDNRATPHKELRPVTFVPPAPPVAVSESPLETTDDLIEQVIPQPVATPSRDRRARSAPQAPVTVLAAGSDTAQARDFRSTIEMPEIVRQVVAVEPQRQSEPRALSVPTSPSITGVHLGATPSAVASDLNVLRAEVPVDTISTPVRAPGWSEKLAERVVVLAGVQNKTAEIRLTPAELGPLRVQISVEDGQAHVAFQAHHAVTREAIEQALPRLREMLAESGLSLGQADVGEQGVAGGEGGSESESGGALAAQDDALDEHEGGGGAGRQKSVIGNGLIDTFA